MKLREEKGEKNAFYINSKREFKEIPIEKKLINVSFDFAYNMVFGAGHHRENRSGGLHKRKKGELFANTFQGKLAEYLVYDALIKNGIKEIEAPDISVHGEGVWDDTDLAYKGKKINIKSAAFFSNLLLLEAKDWNKDGEYVPNLDNPSSQRYDYFLMVRIKPDIKTLFKKERLLYSDEIEIEKLKEVLFKEQWFFDFAGVCSDKTIKHIIAEGYFLAQSALLNGSILMDADNYYVQSGDLKDFSVFTEALKDL